MSNLIETQYEHERKKFKERLAAAWGVSIGLDLWTKKGLTVSFLAISACYFCVEQGKPAHILLALEQVAHPHTAQSIKACVDKMYARVPSCRHGNGPETVCGAYHTTCDSTLQKETTVKRVLDKTRSVVKLFRKSSVATQRLLDQCGLIVVNDCPTRWSSTFNMVTRLLTVKDAVCQIANDMGWDSLLTSEWQKLSSVHDLLLPFAEHTKTLQSDTTSMSLVVPALFDLLSHLNDFAENTRYRDLAALENEIKSEPAFCLHLGFNR
ncbi:Zinc finger BED domain-containing protein 4 [Merluccius polli]|uniref:Zinc finger BED domain-containing protein 4 n=1 Tax=Merluccius polli TaxID=89951 RepID=A0AA47NY74_MERPO|nr:Zinc finger BED domain-containing protein 4 [Merluccius polli]